MTETVDAAAKPLRGTSVELQELTLRVGGRTLLENTSARFEHGEVTLIVGCSGVGKSLLLRVLMENLPSKSAITSTGKVWFDGLDGRTLTRPPVGVVFQHFALFDELSPIDNVRFARAHRGSKDRPAESPTKLLDELRVPTNVGTSNLSGGQQQRLAIARTLAFDPDIILYDEPTSGLDSVNARQVAELIQGTQRLHPKTSIVVTHDYESLPRIADRIYLLDPVEKRLVEIPKDEWPNLGARLKSPLISDQAEVVNSRAAVWLRRCSDCILNVFASTSRVAEEALLVPLRLIPIWKSPLWGARYLLHYLNLVAGVSAWLYVAIAGVIIGFVTTYFTFEFLPYAQYTEPLIVENLLHSMGFSLYRILVPVLVTILIASRCGAAVASDIGGKTYAKQTDALRTFGVKPERYLLTSILYAFLIGTPLLVLTGYYAAKLTSLLVFTITHHERGPVFWHLHFHHDLVVPDQAFYAGTGWLMVKLLCCAIGIGLIAYHHGAKPKSSSIDVSRGITTSILWSTLYVLVVHFTFTFLEF